MIINGKSVRNVDKYLAEFQEGECLYIGLRNVENFRDELNRFGFIEDSVKPYSFVPRPLKPTTDFNVNGRLVVDKSLPMEARTFERQYHVVDWHGNHHYGTCYYTRDCYQNRLIEPPEVELKYFDGLLISPVLVYSEENKPLIRHIINMYLEMFGQCETLTKEYTPKKIKMERFNWTLLPKGEYPWEKAKLHLEIMINSIQTKHRVIISKRHEVITKLVPDLMAIGDQGFWGYVIYGFTNKGIYIFESNKPNNATYVFRGNWKEASQLSKAEIISGGLHEARIVHNHKWEDCINRLIES